MSNVDLIMSSLAGALVCALAAVPALAFFDIYKRDAPKALALLVKTWIAVCICFAVIFLAAGVFRLLAIVVLG